MQILTPSQPVALKFCFLNRLPGGGAAAAAEITLTSEGSQQSIQKDFAAVVKSGFLPFSHDLLYSSASTYRALPTLALLFLRLRFLT